MTTSMNLIKKTAQAAFRCEYGVEPKLKDIILLEATDDRTYIMFQIGKHEYQFNSYIFPAGSDAVWCGDGTLTMYS